MKSDKTVSVEKLKSILRQFRDKRNWAQFHDPKNLAEAITIEASELLELFLWKRPEEIERLVKSDKSFKMEVENELADIFCFALNFANSLDLDISTIVRRKVNGNAKRYPVRKSRGNAAKYTKL